MRRTVSTLVAGALVAFTTAVTAQEQEQPVKEITGTIKKVVADEGGQIVDGLKTAPDFLVEGDGVGGNPPAARGPAFR